MAVRKITFTIIACAAALLLAVMASCSEENTKVGTDTGARTTTARVQTAPVETVRTDEVEEITSFEECAARGYPIQETFPPRCVAGGQVFVQAVTVTDSFAPPAEPAASATLHVFSPAAGSYVQSPLVIEGEAAGWYFEAEFPVRLLDADRNVIATGYATAQGDWMTTEFVPFEATLNFAAPATATGILVLEKSNARGDAEVPSVEVPVSFTS